ncbi:MAG: DNA-directed RNA polymerase subunit omega [Candidatus Micrarchaeota archaeon]
MGLTKYEKARLIGARAFQIYLNAPIRAEISGDELDDIKIDYIKIAEKELERGNIPLKIVKQSS